MASLWSKLTGWTRRKKNSTLEDLAPGRPSTLTKQPEPARAKIQRGARNFKIKQVGLENLREMSNFGFGRDDFEAPEYLLSEVNTIRDIESIVARLFDRMAALSWKEGWKLESRNEQALAYVERRLYETEVMSWRPVESVFRDAFNDLIAFSNAFILKVRREDFSSGNTHKLGGRELKPIAALEVLDPVTMFPIRERRQDGTVGRHIGWQQVVEDDRGGSQQKFFSLADVVHVTFRKKGSHLFGTPLTVPVADDIRSLRRNEEYMDIVSAKNAFPTYQYRIGDKDNPPEVFEGGYSEIDIVQAELNQMPPEGVLVVPGHHVVEPINVSGSFVDVVPYIGYYRKRVVTGMGASLIDIGESDAATRDSANNVSQNLIDLMKDMQDAFEEKVSLEIFQELLLEAGDRFQLSPANKVFMIFHEIDQEAKEKRENHVLNMVEKSFYTINEGRRALGMRDLEDADYEDMYFTKVVIPTEKGKLVAQADENIRVNKESPRPVTGGSVASRPTKTNSTTANRNNPTNQNGPRGAAARRATRRDSQCGFDILQDFSSDPSEREMPISRAAREAKKSLNDAFANMRFNIMNRVKGRSDKPTKQEISDLILSVRSFASAASVHAADGVDRYLRDAMAAGVEEFTTETGLFAPNTADLAPVAKDFVVNAIDRLYGDLTDAIVPKLRGIKSLDSPVVEIASLIDSFKFRIDQIARSELAASRNYGFAIAARENGIKTLDWTRRRDCSQCQTAALKVDTASLTYDKVRAFVPNCGDKLKVPDEVLSVIEEGTDV